MNLWNTYVQASHARFIGSLVYDHLVEPFVTNYIDNIDVEDKMQKDYDTSSYTDEELAQYESAGNDMAMLAENIAKYSVDTEDPDSIKSALFRMAGRIGESAADDPVMAGKYVSDFKFGSNQLLGAAQYVNSQIEQNEASGMAITPDEILSWGKEGLGKAAVETAVETVNQTSEAENETADAEPIDREAMADELVSNIDMSSDQSAQYGN